MGKVDYVEAYRDDEGHIWMPPTAWAYMAACRAQRYYHDVLEAIANGDVPRPRSKCWRDDGVPSKADKCSHDMFMYEDCARCVEEFALRKLREPIASAGEAGTATTPKSGVVHEHATRSEAEGDAQQELQS